MAATHGAGKTPMSACVGPGPARSQALYTDFLDSSRQRRDRSPLLLGRPDAAQRKHAECLQIAGQDHGVLEGAARRLLCQTAACKTSSGSGSGCIPSHPTVRKIRNRNI